MNHVAVLIGEDLKLNMARIANGAFEDQFVRPERARRFGTCPRQRIGEIERGRDQPHAPPATAGSRFHHQRKADAGGCRRHSLVRLILTLITRHARDAGCAHQLLGARLVAHGSDRRRGRADEDEPGGRTSLGERGILGKEAIAGMNRVGPGALGSAEQGVDVQIAVARRRRPDMHRHIGLAHMQRIGIRVAEDGDGAITQRLCRAHDPARDLAAIGDQDFAEAAHRH